MNKIQYRVLGVMSGTSLDGIDLAVCEFVTPEGSQNGKWEYSIGKAETLQYPKLWKEKLQKAVSYSEIQLKKLNEEYTSFLADCIKSFISVNQIKNLDAVCSHGHTILHQPQNGITLQIGNLPKISGLLQQKVVCDFRVNDVAMGGQGAPLVPVGDQLLFSDFEYCLNLGGFANISTQKNDYRIAYDICPVNIVLNFLSEKLGLPYDKDGEIAKSGKISQQLLKQLNALEYYRQDAPKSLGLEWVQQHIFPLLAKEKSSVQDTIATFTLHAAKQIAANVTADSNILITGGGAYNTFLVGAIGHFSKAKTIIPDEALVEFKEALIFGFLGVRKLRNEINCLASVTGASTDHSSGVIFHYT